jgi:signal transduction histidine kinase
MISSVLIFWSISFEDNSLILGTSIFILNTLFTIFLTKIRRFKKGLSFFNSKENLGIGLIVSGFIVGVINLNNDNHATDLTILFIILGLLVSSIGLYLWIRKSITDHYRKKLQAKADEHYQNTLYEKEQQIEQLYNSNAFLSKVVHRDNHLMSALQHTISEYKSCDSSTGKEKLLNEILTLAEERNDLIVKEQTNSKILPTTGLSIIDGALSNMYIKASAHNIEFNLIVNQDIHYLVNNLITQTDLETLLCDHIKDAIIAITSDDNIKGRILITITMNDDIYEISIKDNGIDFETDTLAKLGQERITTHKETGGSGIGFMTTFETLKKSKASLIITEYEIKTPFSKSITFRFDGLGTFIIKSNRADLLRQTINRNDIIITKN